MTASTEVAAMLDVLGWSTSQGDAAVAGDLAAEYDRPLHDCPWSPASTLAHPWRAGWIARRSMDAAPAGYEALRSAGSVEVVLRGQGAAASLALRVDLLGSTVARSS